MTVALPLRHTDACATNHGVAKCSCYMSQPTHVLERLVCTCGLFDDPQPYRRTHERTCPAIRVVEPPYPMPLRPCPPRELGQR